MALTAQAEEWSGTKSYTANTTITEAITVSGAVTVDVSSGKTVTLKGTITGTDKITKTGLGTLFILSANSGFSGGFVIEKGYLTASNATALGSAAVTIIGQTAENSGDCCLGLWGTGTNNITGITYANDINVTGNTTYSYPALVVYGQRAKLTGKVTADKDFVFYDDYTSTAAIWSGKSNRATDGNVISLTFGEVEVGGMLFHDGWCRFIFGGKVTALAVSFAWLRSTAFDGNLGNRWAVYEFNAASEIGTITNDYHNLILNAANVFNDTKYVIDSSVTMRGLLTLNGNAQSFNCFDTAPYTAAESSVRGLTSSSLTTVTIDGGGEMPAGLQENRVACFERFMDKLNLTVDAYDGFTQVISNRSHTMSGMLTVNNGALEIGGNASFTALPTIVVGSAGKLTVDTTCGKAFKALTSITVNGTLELTANVDTPIPDTAALAIGESGRVDLSGGVLAVKSLTVNGVEKSGTLTHSDLPDNLAEGSTIIVKDTDTIEYTDEDKTASGDWHVYVFKGCTNMVRVAQTGNGRLIKEGPGILMLTKESSYKGGTTISAGYVRVETNNVFGTGEITILGQRGNYSGPCEIDMIGFPQVNKSITYHTTITNDIHITGNPTIAYPAIVGFNNGSIVSGKIIADGDFCFMEDQITMRAVAGEYSGAYNKITSLTFGELRVNGTIMHDGWATFEFKGEVNSDVFLAGRYRSTEDGQYIDNWKNARYIFSEKASFNAITNYNRTMTFNNTLSVTGQYYALRRGKLNGGSLIMNGTSTRSIGGLGDTAGLSASDTIWDYTAESDSTLTITGLGSAAAECNTTYKFDGALSIDLDATDNFTQCFSNRVNAMTGAITVKKGTLKIVGTATFANVTGIVVAAGASFSNLTTAAKSLVLAKTLTVNGRLSSPAEAFDSATTALNKLSLGENAELDLQGGELRVTTLTVNGNGKAAGIYDSQTYPQIKSGRLVVLADAPGFTPTSATWNGTAWDPSGVNLLDGSVAATFDSTVSASTFDAPTRLYGITFAADSTGYSVGGSGPMVIGQGGIRVADSSGTAHTYTFANKMEVIGDQDWIIPPKGKLVFDNAITNQAGKITVRGGKTSKIACDLVFKGTNILAGAMVVTGATVSVSGLLGTPNHENQGAAVWGGAKTLTVNGNNAGKASICLNNGTIEKPMSVTYSGDSVMGSANNTTNYICGDIKWGASSSWFGFRPGTNAEIIFVVGFKTGLSLRTYGTDYSSTIRIRDTPIDATASVGLNIASGTVALDVEGNKFNFLSLPYGNNGSKANLDFGVSYAITNNNTHALLAGFYYNNDNGLLRSDGGRQNVYFHSTTQKVSTIAGNRTTTFYAEEGARLEVYKQISPSTANNRLPNDRIYFESQIEGPLTILMGAGEVNSLPLILSNQTFHSSGALIVTNGVLELAADASWLNGTNFTAKGEGTLKFGAAGQVNSDFAVLHIDGDGKVEIPENVTNIVYRAETNGVWLKAGNYTCTGDDGAVGATGIPQLTGAGVLSVRGDDKVTTYDASATGEPNVKTVIVSNSWVEANVPEGKSVTNTPTGGNGYPYWKSYVLGLTPTNPVSKPIIKGVQGPKPDKLNFTLGNVQYNSASGVKVKYKIKVSNSVNGGYSYVDNSETNAGEVVEIPLPSNCPVKYYKVNINYSN